MQGCARQRTMCNRCPQRAEQRALNHQTVNRTKHSHFDEILIYIILLYIHAVVERCVLESKIFLYVQCCYCKSKCSILAF